MAQKHEVKAKIKETKPENSENNHIKNKITTIKLNLQTKQRLEKLREHKRESYDDLLRKMLYILSTVRVDSDKSKEILDKIDETRKKMDI